MLFFVICIVLKSDKSDFKRYDSFKNLVGQRIDCGEDCYLSSEKPAKPFANVLSVWFSYSKYRNNVHKNAGEFILIDFDMFRISHD